MDNGSSHFNARLAPDPMVWRIWLLTSRLGHKVKSLLLARFFHAPGLYLGPRCVVRGSRHISFGRRTYAHSDLWLEAVVCYANQRFVPIVQIGDDVSFSKGVHITSIHQITLESGVLIGSHVYISDHNHGVYRGATQSHPAELPARRELGGGGPVIIGHNVWIGDNAVLLGPLVIGDGAVIASNSVVKRNVEPRTIVAGIPARPIKRFDESNGTWNRI